MSRSKYAWAAGAVAGAVGIVLGAGGAALVVTGSDDTTAQVDPAAPLLSDAGELPEEPDALVRWLKEHPRSDGRG